MPSTPSTRLFANSDESGQGLLRLKRDAPETERANRSSRSHGQGKLRDIRRMHDVALLTNPGLIEDILALWLQELGSSFRVTHCLADQDLSELAAFPNHFEMAIIAYDRPDAPHSAVDAIQHVSTALPDTPIVLVSDAESPDAIVRALQHGARGYIPTTLEPSVATAALRLVISGGIFAPAIPLLPQPPGDANPKEPSQEGTAETAVAPPVANGSATDTRDDFEALAIRHLGVTTREAEILYLLQKGRSNRQLAAELRISENTVIVHIRHLMRKLGATNRTQAVFNALQMLASKQ